MTATSLGREILRSAPYWLGFLAVLVLLVKRDRDAVRLMGYSLQPRYQKLQDSWHLLGYAAVATVGLLLATARHGVSWPALLFASVLSVSWWIGFDVLLNDELDHALTYVGKTGRIDRATRWLAAWLTRWVRARQWFRHPSIPPERLMVVGKLLASTVTVAGYVRLLMPK